MIIDPNQNESLKGNQTISWRKAIGFHLLLFGYWLTPKSALQEVIKSKNSKILILALLNIIICTFISTLGLLGIIDGQEVIVELLKFNPFIWSKMLFNYGIYSFILLFGTILGIGFFIPLITLTIINKIEPKEKQVPFYALFITSSYMILPIIFYTPLIYAIGFLSLNQNPQLAQLMPEQFWNTLLYSFFGLILISLFSSIYGTKKLLT